MRRFFFLMICALGVAYSATLYAQPAGTEYAAPADIPPSPGVAQQNTAPMHAQTIQRTRPTLDEEIQQTSIMFSEAYEKAKSPRIMILFNRDMEDNDNQSLEKVAKIAVAGSSITESGKSGVSKRREEGVVDFYQKMPKDPNDYGKFDIELLQENFEYPFIEAGAKIINRDIAIRLSGSEIESIFSNSELPETKTAQVASIKKHADILIVVKVKQGTFMERKVSGDYAVECPNMIARAINLKDASTMATATTNTTSVTTSDYLATRVALALMNKLSVAM